MAKCFNSMRRCKVWYLSAMVFEQRVLGLVFEFDGIWEKGVMSGVLYCRVFN